MNNRKRPWGVVEERYMYGMREPKRTWMYNERLGEPWYGTREQAMAYAEKLKQMHAEYPMLGHNEYSRAYVARPLRGVNLIYFG